MQVTEQLLLERQAAGLVAPGASSPPQTGAGDAREVSLRHPMSQACYLMTFDRSSLWLFAHRGFSFTSEPLNHYLCHIFPFWSFSHPTKWHDGSFTDNIGLDYDISVCLSKKSDNLKIHRIILPSSYLKSMNHNFFILSSIPLMLIYIIAIFHNFA